MQLNRTNRIVLSVIVLAAAAALTARRMFFIPAATSSYVALAFMGVIVLCLRLRPSWRNILWILVAGAGVAIELRALIHPLTPAAYITSLGMGSLLVMAIEGIWAEGEDRNQLLLSFMAGSLLVLSDYFGLALVRLTQDPRAKVLDLYLYSFDCSLHVNLSFLMGQAFSKSYWLNLAGQFFYTALCVPMGLVFAGQLLRNRSRSLEALAAFLVTAPIGVAFYKLFPALGPVHVFQKIFPDHSLTYQQASRLFLEPIVVPGIRNAMPSLHMTWMLLALWYSRGLSLWERSVALLFVVMTVLATLGTGEHYFVDLVVAFPFALMISGICSFSLRWTEKQRLGAVLYGLTGTLIWLVLLRYETRIFWLSPIFPWAACALTVGLAAFHVNSSQRPTSVAEAGEPLGTPVKV